MAISTTTLNGTDSIAASRITINDNFNTIKSALNDLLSIIDIATGKINNSTYGSNNDIETEDLIVKGSLGGGISVISGGITVSSGPIVINSSYLQIGSGTNSVYLTRDSRTLPSGSIPVLNLSGAAAGATGAGNIGYVALPRLDTATIKSIEQPTVGSMVYSIGATSGGGVLLICTATGTTGTWKPVTLGAAI